MGVEGHSADEFLTPAREAAAKVWWETSPQTPPPEYADLIGTNGQARFRSSWAPLMGPGLLQTVGYTRDVVGTSRRPG